MATTRAIQAFSTQAKQTFQSANLIGVEAIQRAFDKLFQKAKADVDTLIALQECLEEEAWAMLRIDEDEASLYSSLFTQVGEWAGANLSHDDCERFFLAEA